MLIYAVADIHGKESNIELIEDNIDKHNPDILVVAGDVTNRFTYKKTLEALNDLGLPVVLILGNSDWNFIHKHLEQSSNLKNLNLRNYFGSEFSFAGISGTIPIPFRNFISFNEAKKLELLSEFMKKDTVLVVHPPPYGILDMVFKKYHTGSHALRSFIEKYQPQLVLCGHIHDQSGRAFIGNTLVVNCAMNKNCSGAIIKLEQNLIPKAELVKD